MTTPSRRIAAAIAVLTLVLLSTQIAAAQTPAKIDAGDTAWMMTATALVLMMTIPGLALFYGGMVRKMNVLSTVMQSFAITCLVTVLWAVIGYSFAFTEGTPFLGGTRQLLLSGMTVEYSVLQTRMLADDVVLGYLRADFAYPDRASVGITLGVVVTREGDHWRIAFYEAARRAD